MAQYFNFGRMQKKYFGYRGELQNDSITGVSSDEKTICKDLLNRVMRRISDQRPPFLKNQWQIRIKDSVPLGTATTQPTVTSTKGEARVYDSNSSINQRQKLWYASDGTYKYRVISTTGTTYNLDFMTSVTATTATLWTAYKDIYPLPHNCDNLIDVYVEDQNRTLAFMDGVEFNQHHKNVIESGSPRIYAIDAFTNRYNPYKFSISTTLTNGANTFSTGTTNASHLDYNDVLLVDTATTDEYLHTIIGLNSTGEVWLDREYTGDTGAVTLYVNPREHVSYISLWPLPSADMTLYLTGYTKPQDMVSDSDICLFPKDYAEAVVVGALLEDSASRHLVPQAQAAWFNELMENLRHTRDAAIRPYSGRRSGGIGRSSLRGSDFGTF